MCVLDNALGFGKGDEEIRGKKKERDETYAKKKNCNALLRILFGNLRSNNQMNNDNNDSVGGRYVLLLFLSFN